MTPYTIENDVLAVLAAPLAAGGASLTLSSAAPPMRNPPQPLSGRPGVLTLTDRISNPSAIEVITYATRAINGDGTITLSGIVRAREGSVAQDWEPGSFAYQAPTRDLLQFSQHLASLDGLAGSVGGVPFFSAAEAIQLAPSTAFGRSAWSVADAAAFRALIGVGALQSVGVTAPLTSTGGLNPTIGLPAATSGSPGHMTAAQAAKLDGIAPGAQTNVATNLGVGGSGNAPTITSSTGSSASLPLASGAAAGLMSLEDKTKVDGVQAGAQVNVATNLSIGGTAAAPTVTSSTGTSATLPVASGAAAGVTTLASTTPAALGTAAAGSGASAARADHVHAMPTAAQVGAIATTHPINPVTALGAVPSSVGTSNSAGSSTAVARADHVHAHGDQAGGSLHASATSGAAGFMSSADKAKLDAVSFAGVAGRLAFLNGSGGISTSASLSYDTNTDRIVAQGIRNPNQLDLGAFSTEEGSSGLSLYTQVITGGIASWQWTVRSSDGFGLIRMRLLSGSSGPEIAIGGGAFGPIWHHENLNPASFPALGSVAGAALAAAGAAGSATTAARSDHVHPRPTPAEIGAAAASHTHTASQISDSTAAGRALLTAADAAAQRAAMSVESITQLNTRDTGNRERSNHTGNQLAGTISDFNAAARSQLESALVAGTNVTFVYAGLGATRTITINATGGGGGSASVGPAGAIQSSNGAGGFSNSGASVDGGGRLRADDAAFGTIEGGFYGFMRVAWQPGNVGNPSHGDSQATITLEPNALNTAGRIRLQAQNSAGSGIRWLDIEGDQAEPIFFNGSFRNMLHTGNVRTVGGQSIFGSGDIAAGGSNVISAASPFLELNSTSFFVNDWRLRTGVVDGSRFDFQNISTGTTPLRLFASQATINSATVPTETTLFVQSHSGSQGAHIDVRTTNNFGSSIFDAQSPNYATNFSSILMAYTPDPGFSLGTFLGQQLNNTGHLLTAGADLQMMLVGSIEDVPVILGTGNVERMRLSENGNIGINNPAPAYAVDVVGTLNATELRVGGVVVGGGGGGLSGNVSIEGTNLRLAATTDPAAPAAGGLLVYAVSVAGRVMPKVIGPSGIDTILQPGLGGNSVFMVSPSSGTAAPTVVGGTLTTAATMSLQFTAGSTNRWTSTARKRFQTSTTAGNASGVRTAYTQWFRGSAAGFGGFWFRAQYGAQLNLNGGQAFVGLCQSTALLSADPSAQLNMCGVGYDAADANTGNWFFMRNDGAGVATKVNMGASCARGTTQGWDLVMFMAPGGSELFVRVTNLNTGVVALDTSYTTDLPAVNVGMAFKADVRNGAVAAAANLEIAKVYIETDY